MRHVNGTYTHGIYGMCVCVCVCGCVCVCVTWMRRECGMTHMHAACVCVCVCVCVQHMTHRHNSSHTHASVAWGTCQTPVYLEYVTGKPLYIFWSCHRYTYIISPVLYVRQSQFSVTCHEIKTTNRDIFWRCSSWNPFAIEHHSCCFVCMWDDLYFSYGVAMISHMGWLWLVGSSKI